MAWKLNSGQPIYLQIVTTLKSRIISGTYPPGSKLPSVRTLAMEAAVNPNTMQRAMSELEREGIIVTNRTSGHFITEDVNVLNSIKYQGTQTIIYEMVMKLRQMGLSDEEIMVQVQSFLAANQTPTVN
ncbi:MAG: GntR family transcriptional regulator [Lachnospiraceae bacterium]|nr:GntR family transcriptional regulator [Lachnospiraceae bacterium]